MTTLLRSIACLREPDEATTPLLNGSSGAIQWADFLKRCQRHRLSGLAWKHLQPHPSKIPGFVLDELQARYQTAQALHIVYGRALVEVDQAFRSAEIRFLIMRGAVLAEELYGDGGLRPYGDIDVLVSESDIERARTLLTKHGYGPHASAALMRDGVIIDLHGDIFNRDRFPARRYFFAAPNNFFFENARTIPFESTRVPVLDHRSNLMLLALHLTKHGFAQMIWWVDLVEWINRFGAEIDWVKLEAEAREWNSLSVLDFGLEIAASRFAAKVPASWADRARQRHHRFWYRRFAQTLDGEMVVGPATHLLMIESVTGLRPKTQYLSELLRPRVALLPRLAQTLKFLIKSS